MAKSLRSKRKMRLRTIKREIAEPHFEKKELEKQAALEAAMAAPKVEVRRRESSAMAGDFWGFVFVSPAEIEEEKVEEQEKSGGGAMETDMMASSLKPKKSIKKRSKSRGRLKKEKHRQKKLKF
ncbi:hypothetical protein SELMODRAFT_418044 [Selaginella moellendorffii]|uniref:Uncharacterized protein n=1 Tax=Selaginella moellendorffii TaxID=88036 RepID=D8S4H0_SELML|nr:hypothetical protein SELMODRAFT_418044 [Selaginella moellendorffii]